MSVKLLDNSAFYGFRVRRTIDGKVYQEYFSLKAGGQRLSGADYDQIQTQANLRDDALKLIQRDTKEQNKARNCFRQDGSVRGLSYLLKQEKSGNQTPIYQLGIASLISGKILCTSVSVAAYGEDEAWQRIVALYCKHKLIATTTVLYRQLLKARPVSFTKKTESRKAA